MSLDQIDIIKRALIREKKARKQAEKILEDKSRALLLSSEKLEKENELLENLLGKKSASCVQSVTMELDASWQLKVLEK